MRRAKPNSKMKKRVGRSNARSLLIRVIGSKQRIFTCATQKVDFLFSTGGREAAGAVVEFAGYLKNSQNCVNKLGRDPKTEIDFLRKSIPFGEVNRQLVAHKKEPLSYDELKALFYRGIRNS